MLVSTITQTNDYDLTCDIEEIPAQHSSNVEFVFNKLDKYNNYTTEVHFAHLENRFVECSNIVGYATTIDRTGKFRLPSVAFGKDGYIAINFSLTNANETIYTKPLVYKVHKSVSGTEHINNLPWEQLVINFVDTTITPLVKELEVIKNETEEIKNSAGTVLSDVITATTNANTATTNANEAVKRANTATTNAQNATTSAQNATVSANSAANSVVIIRNGTTTPASSLGKSGDFYVNTINGDFYLKSGSSWSKKFNMIALDQITELKNAFNSVTSLTKQMFLLMHPIGCIYMSTSSVSPQTTFGGTWIRWGNGRVPVGVDSSDSSFNTVEKTGGEKQHTLTVNEIPSHRHAIYGGCTLTTNSLSSSNSNGWIPVLGGKAYNNNDTMTDVGGNQSHNNLQPYITCYMWKRTA